ncbi:MAG: hypothetical protein N2653_03620 [Burkholderiales bacterium]|nr:hypothetical protein [Burkholderiales bacterium]
MQARASPGGSIRPGSAADPAAGARPPIAHPNTGLNYGGHAPAAVRPARERTACACGISPHHLAEVLRTLARAGHLESCAAHDT